MGPTSRVPFFTPPPPETNGPLGPRPLFSFLLSPPPHFFPHSQSSFVPFHFQGMPTGNGLRRRLMLFVAGKSGGKMVSMLCSGSSSIMVPGSRAAWERHFSLITINLLGIEGHKIMGANLWWTPSRG